ncbi:MAG: ribonuclease III [Clostridiales bacterium]|nr:ribonuclease III [Clostridiales bacterium]
MKLRRLTKSRDFCKREKSFISVTREDTRMRRDGRFGSGLEFESGLGEVEKIIGYVFKDRTHLEAALTHSSANANPKRNYERLEFLGDGILDFVIADYLMRHTELSEGEMTEKRKGLVNKEFLARVVGEHRLERFLIKAEKTESSEKIKSSLFEALIAAVYFDSDIENARKFILKFLGRYIAADAKPDFKSRLNELVGKTLHAYPVYETTETNTDDVAANGEKCFTSGVSISGRGVCGRGRGKTKREAEAAAAEKALELLDKDPF